MRGQYAGFSDAMIEKQIVAPTMWHFHAFRK